MRYISHQYIPVICYQIKEFVCEVLPIHYAKVYQYNIIFKYRYKSILLTVITHYFQNIYFLEITFLENLKYMIIYFL